MSLGVRPQPTYEVFCLPIGYNSTSAMNGHINETAPPLVPIGEVKLVQVQIVVWFVRTCEVWIPFVLTFLVVFWLFFWLFLVLRAQGGIWDPVARKRFGEIGVQNNDKISFLFFIYFVLF